MDILNKTFSKNFIVKNNHSAKNIGSGDLEVLSTPMLVAYIEETCRDFLNNYLSINDSSVGSNININHLAPSKINSNILINIKVSDIKNNKLIIFECEAFELLNSNEHKKVGTAAHTRVIINKQKFLNKL